MLTITLKIGSQAMDIMVLPNQRISEVLKVLKENKRLFFQTEKMLVYSTRKKIYVNQLLTFPQAGIYTGDLLVMK